MTRSARWYLSAGRSGYKPASTCGIAGPVGDGRGVEIDRGSGKSSSVLAGADKVAEGERAGAGAAAIGRGAAVVQRERRGATGDGDGLAQIKRQRDGLAGIEVATRG